MKVSDLYRIAADFGWKVGLNENNPHIITLKNDGIFVDEPLKMHIESETLQGMSEKYFVWKYMMGSTDHINWNEKHEEKLYGHLKQK